MNPWWQFIADMPSLNEEPKLVWESIPQISPMLVLCSVNPMECLLERRMLERQPILNHIIGNKPSTKLVQVFRPTVCINLHVLAQEMEMGVLHHNMAWFPRKGQTREVLMRTGWNLREEAKLMSPIDECPTPNHCFLMNVIIWNCRGALKPSFQNRIKDLV